MTPCIYDYTDSTNNIERDSYITQQYFHLLGNLEAEGVQEEAINGSLLSMVVTAIFQVGVIKYLGHIEAEHEMNTKL